MEINRMILEIDRKYCAIENAVKNIEMVKKVILEVKDIKNSITI